jgi:L-lactate dehydrogenase complex protein LldG
MSSREEILNRVKANKPAPEPLPAQLSFGSVAEADRQALFIKSFESAGGIAVQVPDLPSIGQVLGQTFAGPERLLNTIPAIGYGLAPAAAYPSGHQLAHLELAVVAGSLGVAENGAVWVSADSLPTRVLPFICEHLVLVIYQSQLVGTMHEAYDRLQVAAPGYGVFIAGPSRTADIEQSLVIGAHGPKRAHVFIVEDPVAGNGNGPVVAQG